MENKYGILLLTSGKVQSIRVPKNIDIDDLEVSLIPFKNKNALQTVGYKELFAYFDGEISLEDAIGKIKRNSCIFNNKILIMN